MIKYEVLPPLGNRDVKLQSKPTQPIQSRLVSFRKMFTVLRARIALFRNVYGRTNTNPRSLELKGYGIDKELVVSGIP